MNPQLFIGFLLTILPVFELRAGLPIVLEYAIRNNLSIWPYFFIIIFLNIFSIVLAFLFLDFLHNIFMRIKLYQDFFNRILSKTRKKAKEVEKKIDKFGYLALVLFVAIPLPGTGAWTGAFISWLLGLDRKKSLIAISTGVLIAGLIVLLISLGFLGI